MYYFAKLLCFFIRQYFYKHYYSLQEGFVKCLLASYNKWLQAFHYPFSLFKVKKHATS